MLIGIAGTVAYQRMLSTKRRYLVRYDGSTYWPERVKKLAGGNVTTNRGDYPLTLLSPPIELSSRLVVHFVGADKAVFVAHEAFEAARRGIVFSAIFKPGGGLISMLQMVGPVVVIVVSIWQLVQVSSFVGAFTQQMAAQAQYLEFIKSRLEAMP